MAEKIGTISNRVFIKKLDQVLELMDPWEESHNNV